MTQLPKIQAQSNVYRKICLDQWHWLAAHPGALKEDFFTYINGKPPEEACYACAMDSLLTDDCNACPIIWPSDSDNDLGCTNSTSPFMTWWRATQEFSANQLPEIPLEAKIKLGLRTNVVAAALDMVDLIVDTWPTFPFSLSNHLIPNPAFLQAIETLEDLKTLEVPHAK